MPISETFIDKGVQNMPDSLQIAQTANLASSLKTWLIDHGIAEWLAGYIGYTALVVAVVLLAFITNYIAKRVLLTGVQIFIKRTKSKWDDALLKRKIFTRLSHLAPALVIYYSANLFPKIQDIIERLSETYIILIGLFVLNSFFNAVVDIYNTYPISRQKPIKGYVQIVQIIVSILIGIVAFAILMDQPVGWLLSGFGAMTAVTLLIFKDTILGLVASIQLSANDMVRIGDWIQMPKYGADGDVVDLTLHTVKVQNWDKTITTVPAYALISDAFKNWRGMSESGGRRIKRSISIDMSSITFCTPAMLDRYEKFQLIAEYIRTRRKEIAEFNETHDIDTSELINGRNMTNVGTFRAYLVAYLRSHPMIKQDMTFLVRHLQPNEHGLPIQVYVFSSDQAWANYESIQADIFDHILAVAPLFDLRIFQYPSGNDIRSWTGPYRDRE